MKAMRRFGHLLLAVVFTLGLLISTSAPIYAADFTGKKITAVSVTGNVTVPESQIMAVVKVKPGETFDAEKVKQDMRAIFELGTISDVVANFSENPEGVKITYTVLENQILNSVVFKGNTKVSTDKLNSMLTVTKGTVLNAKTLNDNVRKMEQYYYDQGFIRAKVNDVSMSPSGVLTLSINEGMLEGIVVKGNDKTKTNVITREMKLKPGEPFNVKDAKRSMQKVYNLGIFEDVNMKLNPGREPNAIVLETDVVEQKTGSFTIGGGYSQNDGLVGIIGVGDTNFRGTGDKVNVSLQLGGNAGGRNYSFGYTRPWLDDKQTSLGFNIYDTTTQYTDYGWNGGVKGASTDNNRLRSTYDREQQGWNVTLGRPQGEYVQNYITLSHRNDQYVKYVSGDVNYGALPGATGYYSDYNSDWLHNNFGVTRSVALSRVYDTRDNVFSPTEGKRVALTTEFAGRMFGGDFDYNKYTFEGRQYFKVGGSQVLALRMDAGYATGRMPEAGKFAVGGIDTLRGYEDDQFKGDKMLTATAEYRFPVVKKIEGVVFGDIGNAWDGEGYKLDNLKAGVGVGLRLNTPFGPMRLDYARGDQGGKLHFGFGGQF